MLMLGKTGGKRVWQRIRWLDGITRHDGINGHEFEQTPRDSGGQRSLYAAVHGITKSQT